MSSSSIIEKSRKNSSLDQFILILEISFVFLLVYTLITLFDAGIDSINLYGPLSEKFLGEVGIGNLNGGQYEAIVRITIVFNFLLFSFSLFFGMWMRRTRDGWSFSDLGFTLNTPNYKFRDLVERGLILGFLVIVFHYTIMTIIMVYINKSFEEGVLMVHSFYTGTDLFTPRQLNAEYYFGYVEMGIIWPMSAGFFFFAYTHNSLAERFSRGVASVLSTLFYVYYLLFFFILPAQGKMEALFDPGLWTIDLVMQLLVFIFIMFVSFSAFAETRSIVLPFLLNFVLNAIVTFFRAFNSLVYEEYTPLMLLPYLFSIVILVFWFFKRRYVYSTLKSGIDDVTDNIIPMKHIVGYSVLFIILSFFVPGILEYFVINRAGNSGMVVVITGAVYVLIILIALFVLTYDPISVYDVLLVSQDGRPIASHIELFESDDILISGFFSAIGAVSSELGAGKSDLKSVKRGDREIIIEEGVLSQVIALVDKDQSHIRSELSKLHKAFEIQNKKRITKWDGMQFQEGKDLVKEINKLEVKFTVNPQTRWIGTLSLIFSPILILLLGFVIV